MQAALLHFDAMSLYKLHSKSVDAHTDWAFFKSAVNRLFGKNVGSGFLQNRLFAVIQQFDEPASRFVSRVLELVMKNYTLLYFKDQQQMALGHLIN